MESCLGDPLVKEKSPSLPIQLKVSFVSIGASKKSKTMRTTWPSLLHSLSKPQTRSALSCARRFEATSRTTTTTTRRSGSSLCRAGNSADQFRGLRRAVRERSWGGGGVAGRISGENCRNGGSFSGRSFTHEQRRAFMVSRAQSAKRWRSMEQLRMSHFLGVSFVDPDGVEGGRRRRRQK